VNNLWEKLLEKLKNYAGKHREHLFPSSKTTCPRKRGHGTRHSNETSSMQEWIPAGAGMTGVGCFCAVLVFNPPINPEVHSRCKIGTGGTKKHRGLVRVRRLRYRDMPTRAWGRQPAYASVGQAAMVVVGIVGIQGVRRNGFPPARE